MFVRLYWTEGIKAEKSLSGAVFEYEKQETKTKSVPGGLKIPELEQIFEHLSPTRQVYNFPHFTFLFIV